MQVSGRVNIYSMKFHANCRLTRVYLFKTPTHARKKHSDRFQRPFFEARNLWQNARSSTHSLTHSLRKKERKKKRKNSASGDQRPVGRMRLRRPSVHKSHGIVPLVKATALRLSFVDFFSFFSSFFSFCAGRPATRRRVETHSAFRKSSERIVQLCLKVSTLPSRLRRLGGKWTKPLNWIGEDSIAFFERRNSSN